jgi:hypothetical protein
MRGGGAFFSPEKTGSVARQVDVRIAMQKNNGKITVAYLLRFIT